MFFACFFSLHCSPPWLVQLTIPLVFLAGFQYRLRSTTLVLRPRLRLRLLRRFFCGQIREDQPWKTHEKLADWVGWFCLLEYSFHQINVAVFLAADSKISNFVDCLLCKSLRLPVAWANIEIWAVSGRVSGDKPPALSRNGTTRSSPFSHWDSLLTVSLSRSGKWIAATPPGVLMLMPFGRPV